MPMVKFHGLCDGKRNVKKSNFFGFCEEMSCLFSTKNLAPVI